MLATENPTPSKESDVNVIYGEDEYCDSFPCWKDLFYHQVSLWAIAQGLHDLPLFQKRGKDASFGGKKVLWSVVLGDQSVIKDDDGVVVHERSSSMLQEKY